MARILVIDDEPISLATLCTMLRSGGYEVATAVDGAAGMAVQRAHAFDLVITDIYMPRQEGLETLQQLRQEFPDLPVIAVSGGGARQDFQPLEWASRLGAAGILHKPYDQATVLGLVSSILAA